MKARNIIIVVALTLMLIIIAAPIVFSTSGIAPSLAMPVKITRNGHPLPVDELASIQYAFSEKGTQEVLPLASSSKNAETFQDGYYIVRADFSSIRKTMFSAWTTSPQYRSLALRITLRNGNSLSVAYPVISDTKLNTPIYIDLPN